ncbi:VanW family protein [Oceanobacillus alkalisoli]|uniref:VanW family protein n=1 Tax=Oceanobacillus alkalisoli TaxID=2925113 RepID=UPI001EE3E07B|nr:VanW family protein [Oceanobacillus alkalisoli]MCG5105273.1 VanW family protein [Oceanobacillus alkalisoli]
MRRNVLNFVLTLTLLLFLLSTEIVSADEDDEIALQRDELKSYSLSDWEHGFVDWKKLDELMDQLEEQVTVPPINATLGNGFEIMEEQPGKTLDRNGFTTSFLKAFYTGEDRAVEIPTKAVQPRVDQEMMQEITQKRLGSYTTYYNSANKERTKNINLSAKAVHGTVIFPGEVFSFNDIVGERTEEKGYQRAPVIVKGEFSEDIGGGICQLSSTIFNAVDLRGIQMIERYTHSRSVPYVPPGRDATVSWWGPDFTFKNLYNEPIVLTANAGSGSLTVGVFSSETVEYFQAK